MGRLQDLLEYARLHVPFYARRAPYRYLELDQWPLTSAADLAAHPLDRSREMLSTAAAEGGYLIASGGTLGDPKYIFYSQEEAKTACNNIAANFLANGIMPGDWVVNYFDPGNMWSAFILVDRALSGMPVTILPLGHTPNTHFAMDVIERFKPAVIVGIPTALRELAHCCAERDNRIRIEKVFYGGENLESSEETMFRDIWRSGLIRSAGYASSDFGPIGWQCLLCAKGEYHPFDDVVVEIIDQEIVATSLSRRAMPLIRYRTGDRGEWLECPAHGKGGQARFRLLSRFDVVVAIWGCQMRVEDIRSVFEQLEIPAGTLQLDVDVLEGQEILLVQAECAVSPQMFRRVLDGIYDRCSDLRRAVERSSLERFIRFRTAAPGTLRRNLRTGKVLPVVDRRHSRSDGESLGPRPPAQPDPFGRT